MEIYYFLCTIHSMKNSFETRLKLNFSYLKEHKFSHGFADTINPMCACGGDLETMEHFLLRCHFYSTQRFELFDNLETANSDFKNLSGKDQVSFMLYDSKTNISENVNQNIIKIIIIYLKKESAKSRACVLCVFTCLACLRAWRVCVLACLRVSVLSKLACLTYLRPWCVFVFAYFALHTCLL